MLLPKTRAKPRRFEYTPRFYDPEEDERKRRRVRFQSRVHRGRRPPVLVIALLLALALYIFTRL